MPENDIQYVLNRIADALEATLTIQKEALALEKELLSLTRENVDVNKAIGALYQPHHEESLSIQKQALEQSENWVAWNKRQAEALRRREELQYREQLDVARSLQSELNTEIAQAYKAKLETRDDVLRISEPVGRE